MTTTDIHGSAATRSRVWRACLKGLCTKLSTESVKYVEKHLEIKDLQQICNDFLAVTPAQGRKIHANSRWAWNRFRTCTHQQRYKTPLTTAAQGLENVLQLLHKLLFYKDFFLTSSMLRRFPGRSPLATRPTSPKNSHKVIHRKHRESGNVPIPPSAPPGTHCTLALRSATDHQP